MFVNNRRFGSRAGAKGGQGDLAIGGPGGPGNLGGQGDWGGLAISKVAFLKTAAFVLNFKLWLPLINSWPP